jgi:GntR family transcriptional regulator
VSAAQRTAPRLSRSVTTGRAPRGVYGSAKVALRRLVTEQARAGVTRLPSEDELAEQLEVSRATVRSALQSLQRDGLVQRVHGRGTFVNRHALAITANIVQDWPFARLLSALGHRVESRIESLSVGPCEARLPASMAAAQDGDLCLIERVFHASGRPAVLCVDHVPTDRLETPTDELTGEESVFEFVRRHTGRRVRYSVADLVPVVADAAVAARLGVEAGTPLLLLEHTHIDDDDEPVAFTRAYVGEQLRFSVVRTYAEAEEDIE